MKQIIRLGNIIPIACLLPGLLWISSCKKEAVVDNMDKQADASSSFRAGSANGIQQTNNYFIMPSGASLPPGIAASIAAAGGTVYRDMPQIGMIVASSTSPTFKAQMENVPGVRKAIRDLRVQYVTNGRTQLARPASLPPNSTNTNPFYNAQWGMNAINVEPAWNAGYKGAGARVVVIDNGFELGHPDLAGRFNMTLARSFTLEPVQFQQSADPALFFFSHATHVSGIIAANDNSIGVIGVAPMAEIIPVKALYDEGFGEFADLIPAILYAADINADIINMSLEGSLPKSDKRFSAEIAEFLTTLQKAVNYANQKGVTIIAAAGNSSINRDADKNWTIVPADLANVIAVSATGPSGWGVDPTVGLDGSAFYTNYGLTAIDLSAPGGNIDFTIPEAGPWFADMVLSTANDGDYYYAIGTSMAAPHAAGVAALIVSRYGHLAPAQIRSKLTQKSDDLGTPGKDKWYGHGRVNAWKAIN